MEYPSITKQLLIWITVAAFVVALVSMFRSDDVIPYRYINCTDIKQIDLSKPSATVFEGKDSFEIYNTCILEVGEDVEVYCLFIDDKWYAIYVAEHEVE